MRTRSLKISKSHGFTIIELMIATAIFAVVLLVLTLGVIQVTHIFINGYIRSSSQNTARSIVDDISQGIQLSSANSVTASQVVSGGNGYNYDYFCINGNRFTLLEDPSASNNPTTIDASMQVVPSSTPTLLNYQGYNAFIEDSPASCNGPNVFLPSATTIAGNNVKELLSPNERIGSINVQCITFSGNCTNLWSISLTIIYGNGAIWSDDNGTPLTFSGTDPYVCNDISKGGTFCAVSTLYTTVQQRL